MDSLFSVRQPFFDRGFWTPIPGTKPVLCLSACLQEKELMGEADKSRIPNIDPERAAKKTRRLLGQVRRKLGLVPNFFRVLANAPAALEGYLNFSAALAGGSLDNRIREQIAIAVAESNLCRYCLSAHAFLAEKAGLSPEEIASAARASSSDRRTDAVLKLARSIIVQRGEVSDGELERARAAGLTDGELVETVANIALNIFTNYINHVARTPMDFPEVKSSGGAK
jgi:uncharacterized peroxidase-related enzyme